MRNKNVNKAEWTIMIYMAGDNNLSEFMLRQLKDIQDINHDDRIKVIAQYDPDAEDIETQRYVFKKGKFGSILESLAGNVNRQEREENRDLYKKEISRFKAERDKDVPDTNTGSLWTLYDFIMWSFTNFPAERYMLVMAGHSNSFEAGFLAIDLASNDSLSIPELEYALYLALRCSREKELIEKTRTKLDIIGFDSCLMCSAEVAYELRNHAEYMVGSQGFIANEGWCYGKIFNELAKKPGIKAREFAEIIHETYLLHYFDYIATGMSCDFAILDLMQAEKLKPKVDELADVLLELTKGEDVSGRNSILMAHWSAQTFYRDLHVDIFDFCLMLERSFPKNRRIQTACTNLREVIKGDNPFVISSCNIGAAFQHAHGLSIHFPWGKMLPVYKGKRTELRDGSIVFKQQLDFLRKTGTSENSSWRIFIEEFIKHTRREMNSTEEQPEVSPVFRKFVKELSAHRDSGGDKDILNPRLFAPFIQNGGRDNNPDKDMLNPRLSANSFGGSREANKDMLNPRGGGGIGSMKNPPQDWKLSPCLLKIIEKRLNATNGKAKLKKIMLDKTEKLTIETKGR